MNQIRDHADINVGSSMSRICRDYFGLNSLPWWTKLR